MELQEQIKLIRDALDAIEVTVVSTATYTSVRNWDAMELPSVITSIVDFLQPKLTTYEAVLYWHLFRHSMLGNGTQYVRVSIRGLQTGVAISSSGQTDNFSYAVIQKSFTSMENKGVIAKSGDTNRNGTIYKIQLPDEIPLCAEYRRSKESIPPFPVDPDAELDYYNVQENRIQIFERDDYKCHYCGKQLTRFSATLDHIQPISKGGDNSFGNLVTACLQCNSRRGNRPVMDAIIDTSKNV